MQIKENFTENVPANTRAFQLVISDKMLSFQSDGNKLAAVYLKNLNMFILSTNILRFRNVQIQLTLAYLFLQAFILYILITPA